MLHMILMILKIIGIILLVILGLLLLLILAVLFVPFRYHGKGEKQGKRICGQAGVSWLAHMISVRFIYEDGKTDLIFHIFGIDPRRVAQFLARHRRKKPDKKQRGPEKKQEPQRIEEADPIREIPEIPPVEIKPAEEITAERTVPEKIQAPALPQKAMDEIESADTGSPEPVKKTGRLRSIWQKIRSIFRSIIGIPGHIWSICKKTALTIRTICAKISQWKKFLTDERTKAALRRVRGEIFLILKHIRPRKLQGRVVFGLEDPYETGEILAVLGMLYPFYGNHIQINPQFDRMVLEGELALKGRIYTFVLLRTAWRIYRDKNVKFVIKNFQHKEE
ncbi:MAG: DUF2953 domain-containing protein [Lachnospiraceae bacterium]|nr:DUF2953 domain-containing protein [Lachnospiraceae bacterium]